MMGSYCTIYFDDFEVCFSKSDVPDAFCAIFQESDRLIRLSPDSEDEDPRIVYEAPREVVLARLALLVCTSTIARERMESWLQSERVRWDEYSADYGWGGETADALHALTPGDWYARVPRCLALRFSDEKPIDEIERRMRDTDDSWLWFDGYGSLIGLRALLEACVDVKTVTLDLTDLIGGGWIEADVALCETRRREDPLESRPLAPTVVLGREAPTCGSYSAHLRRFSRNGRTSSHSSTTQSSASMAARPPL
jgi:hypothetical protein